MNDKIKAMSGVGPGATRGAYAEAYDHTIKLAEERNKELAKFRKAERKLEELGFTWKMGEWK